MVQYDRIYFVSRVLAFLASEETSCGPLEPYVVVPQPPNASIFDKLQDAVVSGFTVTSFTSNFPLSISLYLTSDLVNTSSAAEPWRNGYVQPGSSALVFARRRECHQASSPIPDRVHGSKDNDTVKQGRTRCAVLPTSRAFPCVQTAAIEPIA